MPGYVFRNDHVKDAALWPRIPQRVFLKLDQHRKSKRRFSSVSVCVSLSVPLYLFLSACVSVSLCLSASVPVSQSLFLYLGICQIHYHRGNFPISTLYDYKGDCPLCRQCIRCQGKRCEVYLKFFEDNDDEYCPPLRHLGSEIDYGLGVSSEKGRAGMDWCCQEAM